MFTKEEELFIKEYLKSKNILGAYLKAYDVRREDVKDEPYELIKRLDIQEEIGARRELQAYQYDMDVNEYIQFLIKGAFADIGDFLEFGVEEIPEYNSDGTIKFSPDTGEVITRKVNRLYAKDSRKLDTSLITAVSQGRDGLKLQLVDKEKCFERLANMYGWALGEDKKSDVAEVLLKALNAKASDVWSDEEDEYSELRESLKKDDE